jgi:hypothetical protein
MELKHLPYEIKQLIWNPAQFNDVSFKEIRRICLCTTGDSRRNVLADKRFPVWLKSLAQQRYGQIDVGSHQDVNELLDTLISLENALGGKGQTPIYPTCLPYSPKNIACLLPQIFKPAVCKRVNVYLSLSFKQLSFPVSQAILYSTAASGPPKRTTIVMFSKASFTPGSDKVTVDMGVFTAKGWTDVASIVIRRGLTTYAELYPRLPDENPVMNHLRAEFEAAGGIFFTQSMVDVLDKTKRHYAKLPWLQNTYTMYGGVMTRKIDGLTDITQQPETPRR